MELAVKVVLTGGFPVYSTGDFGDAVLGGSKSSRKTASQSGASPQLAESLVAGVQATIPETAVTGKAANINKP